MRKILAVTLFICIASLGPVASARANTAASFDAAVAQDQQDPQYQDNSSGALFSADQLDNLLAPIALYPDPLLAQVLPASTFVDQIDEASRWLRANNDPNGIDEQPWDVSVKSVAHYPSVLYMMSSKIDWTTSLGQAYVNQSTDVMTSIQRLRALAHSAGNLETNPQQQVITQGGYIQIDPIQPQYIYVPVYDPYAVYYRGGYGFGGGFGGNLISFGTGFAIGAWLDYDFDWGGHRVFYHGWGGGEGGWIGRSRPMVQINNTYVNNNYTNIRVNRQIVNNNVNYNNLNRYSGVHRNVTYNNVAAPARASASNPVNRGTVGPPVSQGNPAAANKIIQRNVNINDPRINANRGRQPTQPQQTPQQQQNRGAIPSQATLPRPAAPQGRQPVWQAPPQNTPRPQPAARPVFQQPARPVAQPARAVFGGNQSGIDPRAASQRGQASRTVASQPNARNQSRPASPPPARSSGQSKPGGRR